MFCKMSYDGGHLTSVFILRLPFHRDGDVSGVGVIQEGFGLDRRNDFFLDDPLLDLLIFALGRLELQGGFCDLFDDG